MDAFFIALLIILSSHARRALFSRNVTRCWISFYNLWLLQRKTDLLGEAAEKDGSRKGIGTISRLAAAALGALIAIRYDFSIIGYIIGLMAVYPVIMIDFILFNRNNESKEG